MSTSIESPELTAAEIMSNPVATVEDNSSMWQAGDLMVGLHIRHVVVVKSGRCIGVLTDRDLLEAWHQGPAAIRSTPVRRFIAAATSCVLPDAPLRQVASIMNVNHVDAVPVVDDTGKLLGLVTAGDVVHAVATHAIVDSVQPVTTN